jgi:rRNA-processing protein FCF1
MMTYKNSSKVERSGKVVIFDTNILLFIVRKPLDILAELEEVIKEPFIPVVLDVTLMEISKLTKSKSIKLKLNASTVYDFIIKKFQVVNFNKKNLSVDEAIYQFAIENNCIVVTGDKKLRQMLKHKGIKVICIKNRRLKEC